MPRGLNVTHRELSLTETVVSDIWRPPALQAREDPMPTALCGPVHFSLLARGLSWRRSLPAAAVTPVASRLALAAAVIDTQRQPAKGNQ